MPQAPQRKEPLNYGALNLSTPGAVSPATDAKSQFVANAAKAPLIPPSPAPSAPSGGYMPPPTPGGNGAAPVQYNYNNGIASPAGAPAAPAAPVSSPADDAYSSYLKSLEASPEHKAAQDYLNSLITKSQQDIGAIDAHAGQTTSFAGAEKERANYGNNIAIDAASRALQTYEGIDTNRTTAGKARLDYEQQKAKDSAAANKPIEVSPGATLVDPKTGKSIYTAPTAASQNGGTKPTAAEQQAAGFSVINQLLKPGVKIKGTAGIPYLDNEGYLTPEGLDKLIAAAQSDGISRKDFLDEFGVFIGAKNKFQNYKLTAAEKARLIGA